MAIYKCKMCGGTLEIQNGESVGVCEYCGTKQTLPKLDNDRRANLYDRANHFRRNNEFDKAMGIYEQILNEDSTDAEAYWSIVLCRYGIEYVEDPASHRRVPTVNRTQFTSIFDDDNYKSALQYADGYQKSIYEEEAKAINEIQKGILAISQKEEPFDVFICYKETDSSGRRTPDSVLANDLYHQLTQEGFKVFFSRITLEDKLGTAYEPYIFAALNSAKVMVVLGTKPEYFNAVWVKNEWSRYLALIKNDAKKMLIPAYRDMDPYNLPEEFSHLQAQDMSKLGFMQDLIRGIKKIVSAETVTPPVKESIVSGRAAGANVAPLLRRAFIFLEDGEFANADEYCEKVLDNDPECAEAYLGKLMAELKVRKKEKLSELDSSFEKSGNYKKTIKFGNKELKAELERYLSEINAKEQKAMMEKGQNKEKTSKKALLVTLCIATIIVFALSLSFVIKPINEYNSAVAVMEEGKYEEAIAAFTAMGDYKDVSEKIEECKYREAKKFMENGAYDKAIEKFTNIKDYKDSSVMMEECELQIKEGNYQNAIFEKEKGNFEKALEILFEIEGYKDSKEIIAFCKNEMNEIKYQEAVAYFEAGDFESAKKYFEELKEYKDSVEQLQNIENEQKYLEAVSLMENKKYSEAVKIFTEIKDYKDSSKKITFCNNNLNSGKNFTIVKIDSGIIDGYEVADYKITCNKCGLSQTLTVDYYYQKYGNKFDVVCKCGNTGWVKI